MRLAETGHAEFADQPLPKPATQPLIVDYAVSKPGDRDVLARGEELQRWLNTFPGIFVKVDGIPGEKTSDAYKRITGHYLPGDPRA